MTKQYKHLTQEER